MADPTLQEQLKAKYPGKELAFYQYIVANFKDVLPESLKNWGTAEKNILDQLYNSREWETATGASSTGSETASNQVVQTEDGSFDVVPPEGAGGATQGITLSPDGSMAYYTAKSGNTYFANAKKDLATGGMVYGGWTRDTPPKAPVVKDTFVGFTPQGGYNWPIYKKADGSTYIGDTPLRDAQQQKEAIISEDGNAYWDDTKGWQPTFQYQQQQAQAKAQAESESAQQEYELGQQELMRQYAAQAYQTSQDNNLLWRQAQDRAFVGLTNARTQSGLDWVQAPTAMPDNISANWIDTWNAQEYARNHPATPTWAGGKDAPVAFNQGDAAAKGLNQWVSPQALQAAQQGVDTNYIQTYDPGTGAMRMETDSEHQFRTQTAPMRDIQRDYVGTNRIQGDAPGNYGAQNIGYYGTEWAKANPRPTSSGTMQQQDPYAPEYQPPTSDQLNGWNSQFQAAMTGPGAEAYAEANYRKAPRGPTAPAWAKEFVKTVGWNPMEKTFGNYDPRQTTQQIDMASLKRGSVNPVGTQTWNRMAPSEREGLRGLVTASGENWDDYMANSQRMAPKAGWATARRKTAVY